MNFYKETTGYIIHQRDFKNNSLILEFFSYDHGMIHVVAKGIKNNKRLKSQLHYFSPIKIQYYGKSSLKSLSSINLLTLTTFDNIIEKTAGLYLNELLHYSLIEFEKADVLYKCYENSLSRLGHNKLTKILRDFERELLKHNGFEISINASTKDECWLGIHEQMITEVNEKDANKLCKSRDLNSFLLGRELSKQSQKRFNKFMLHAINMSLNNKNIISRELLIGLTTDKIR